MARYRHGGDHVWQQLSGARSTDRGAGKDHRKAVGRPVEDPRRIRGAARRCQRSLAAIGRLRRRERDAIIAELKNALGRGLGFELTNLSTDKRQVVNNAFSALLQNVIEIHKGDKSQPPSAPQRS
jgi:hypothetical protein